MTKTTFNKKNSITFITGITLVLMTTVLFISTSSPAPAYAERHANIPDTYIPVEPDYIGPPTPAQIEAALLSPNAQVVCQVTSTPVDGQSIVVETLGSQSFPSAGNSYVILSSGNAGIVVPSTAAGTFATISNGNPDNLAFPADVQDGFGNDANDVATLVLQCFIPPGATTLSFDWGFGSDEPPQFTPGSFSDYFRTTGTFGNVVSVPGQAGLLAPVTANNIDQTGTERANPVTGAVSSAPAAPFPSPDDTALNAFICTATSTVACAQPQSTSIDVTAQQGNTITIGFEVADDSDTIIDSAAYIDNLDIDVNLLVEIKKEVIQIEEKLDGNTPSLITVIVDGINDIINILLNPQFGLEEIKDEIIEIELKLDDAPKTVRDNVILRDVSLEENERLIIIDNAGIGGTSDVEVTMRTGEDDDDDDDGSCRIQILVGGAWTDLAMADFPVTTAGEENVPQHGDALGVEAVSLFGGSDGCELDDDGGYVAVSTVGSSP